MKAIFKHLWDVLFTYPQAKNCPYCGGGKCFGMCGASNDQADGPEGSQKRAGAPGPRARQRPRRR